LRIKRLNVVAILITLVALIALPFMIPKYFLYLAIIAGINVILASSLRFINLFGDWSFIHIPLMGLGGYTTALLTTSMFDLPFWISMPISALIVAFIALILSYPILQTGGFYFFLSSFAAGEMLRQLWILFENPFGGYRGIAGIMAPESFFSINFSSYTSMWFLVIFFAAITVLTLNWLEKTIIGVSAKSIKSNESLSKSLGINTSGYKRTVFVIGSFFAGIAGVLYAHFLGYVSPLDYTTEYAYQIMAMVIVGGTYSFVGPLVGVVVLSIVREILHDFLTLLPLVYGIFLVLTLYFLPGGLVSLPRQIAKRMKNKQRDTKEKMKE